MPVDIPLLLDDLGEGLNTIDSVVSPSFPMTQAVSIQNMQPLEGALGRRRNGSSSVLGGHTGSPPTAAVLAWARDNESELAPILWAADDGPTIRRLDPATGAWTAPTVPATPVGSSLYEFNGVAFNSKMFLAYRHTGAIDRLAVYDALLTKVRYVGISAPAAAPTVANTGVGAYAATIRYYRQRYLQKNGAAIIRMGEPSAVVSFTPSGAGTAARITKAATISEDETHWMIEASADNTTFFELATVAVATTTYDDSAAVSTYANGTLAKILGTCTVPPNAKYVVTDGNRIIFANFVEQGAGSRVGWTTVFGSQSIGDDERMFQTSTIRPYQDLNPKNGGDITGLEQIDGVVYVFKAKQIWRGTPTEDLARPYIWRRLTSKIGCVFSKSLTVGEDDGGNPCLYFMSHRGPYRIGPRGLEYLGRDLEGVLIQGNGSPNVNMTSSIIAHSVYYDDAAQWWLWYCSGSVGRSPVPWPDRLYVLNVKRAVRRDTYGVRGGWVQYTGIANALCSTLGPRSGYNGRPWISYGTEVPSNATVYSCDMEGVVTDAGASFTATFQTRSIVGMGRRIHIGTPILQGRVTTAGTASLTVATTKDRNASTGVVSGTVALDATLPQLRPCQDVVVRDATVLQITVNDGGDADPIQWVAESLYIPVYLDSEVT